MARKSKAKAKPMREKPPKMSILKSDDYKIIHGSGAHAMFNPYSLHIYLFDQVKKLPDEPKKLEVMSSSKGYAIDFDKSLPEYAVKLTGEIVIPVNSVPEFYQMFKNILDKMEKEKILGEGVK